jgi:uncharacterized protein
MSVMDALLSGLPAGWQVTDVYVGENWLLSLVRNSQGTVQAGMANAPEQIASQARFQIGHHKLDEAAEEAARWLLSTDVLEAAVGLATLNALVRAAGDKLATADAANWLTAECMGRSLAIFGRFPFIDTEIRPAARRVWVFEQHPRDGEYDSSAMSALVPQANIVAITGSSLINHTIDAILANVRPGSRIVLLGPSTPLSEKLFDCGIDAMFGVRVVNIQQAVASVVGGAGFQKVQGLQRVALIRRS